MLIKLKIFYTGSITGLKLMMMFYFIILYIMFIKELIFDIINYMIYCCYFFN